MAPKPVYHDIFSERQHRDSVMCLWNPPQVYRSHLAYHRELEFHFIKKGNGFYFIRNKRYPLARNHLIVIRTGEIHKFIPSEPYSYIEKGSLYLPPSLVTSDRKLGAIIRKCPHIISLTEEAMLIEFILKNIAEETTTRENNWGDIVNAEITLFLSMIKRCSSRKNALATHNPLTEKIIAYLEQNFARNLSLSDIASSFSHSTSHISHLFKKETGLGIKHYILQRRIIEAEKLLTENTALKVKAVSNAVGFEDFYLFNYSFKKITGLTPTNYRRISKQPRN